IPDQLFVSRNRLGYEFNIQNKFVMDNFAPELTQESHRPVLRIMNSTVHSDSLRCSAELVPLDPDLRWETDLLCNSPDGDVSHYRCPLFIRIIDIFQLEGSLWMIGSVKKILRLEVGSQSLSRISLNIRHFDTIHVDRKRTAGKFTI